MLRNYEMAETDEGVGTSGFIKISNYRLGEKAVIVGLGELFALQHMIPIPNLQ